MEKKLRMYAACSGSAPKTCVAIEMAVLNDPNRCSLTYSRVSADGERPHWMNQSQAPVVDSASRPHRTVQMKPPWGGLGNICSWSKVQN